MSIAASIVAAFEVAGIAVFKGAASAAGSGSAKIVGRRLFGGKTRAADDVMAMAIVRAIEEARPESDNRDVEWWTRAGQALIKPLVKKDVADGVLRTVVAYPESGDDTRETFVAALELADEDLYQLARTLEFDAERFLSVVHEIILDELIIAAADPDSPLLPLAQYATARQIAAKQISTASAAPEPVLLTDLVEVASGEELPMVTELDPYRLGATPSHFGSTDNYGERDPYVARTRDRDLATALTDAAERKSLVLLVGPSKVGKTRTAFEAIRTYLPQAHLLFPRPGVFDRLVVHPRLRDSNDAVVVWLDDLDRYLTHSNPLTPSLLSRLVNRSGTTIALATLRQEQRDRLQQIGELTRDSRLLLDHAITIDLAPLTNADPKEEAAARVAYPGQELRFGLAAHLAGAPELTRRYDDARYTDPMQRAVIEVAIDWVRTGRPDPIPEAILNELSLNAFELERPDLDGTNQDTAAAIKDARTPPEGLGRVAALTTYRLPDGSRAYRPFDYLVAADDGQHHPSRPIPEYFWEKALKDADPEISLAVSLAAFQRNKIPLVISASEQAAAAGQAHAMFGLGVMAQARNDMAAARVWYLRAAAGGDTDAMVNLGVLLAERSDPPELDAARRWYEKAADAGDTDAMFNLGVLFADLQDSPDLDAARGWYEKALAAGNTMALVNLGAMAVDRDDLETARGWYERAVAAGHIFAMVSMGMTFLKQTPPDTKAARDWFEKAADKGNSDAMFELGRLFGDRDELDAAREWFDKAANAGNTHAMVQLAILLAETGDRHSAFDWAEKAARAGNVHGMNYLGLLLTQQDPPNLDSARAWFTKAADKGGTHAMVNLGNLLSQQDPPDLASARGWFEKAADEEHTGAMVGLGALFAKQDPPDLASARGWFEKAAEEGDTDGMLNLGALATQQDPPDFDAACRWLEKAANAGNAEAMFNLGVLLASRRPPDETAARVWLTRAVQAGYRLDAD